MRIISSCMFYRYLPIGYTHFVSLYVCALPTNMVECWVIGNLGSLGRNWVYEVLIICAWPNQTNYATFNLYDYSLVAAITLCCYAYMVHCCNLVLIGTHLCFVVNCKSSYAISTMLGCMACAKVITLYILLQQFPQLPFPQSTCI